MKKSENRSVSGQPGKYTCRDKVEVSFQGSSEYSCPYFSLLLCSFYIIPPGIPQDTAVSLKQPREFPELTIENILLHTCATEAAGPLTGNQGSWRSFRSL